MAPLPSLVRVFGDPTRLRILAALEGEELSAGELARVLGMTQSRISNQLRLLREAHLLQERHVGANVFLRSGLRGEALLNGHDAVARRLWQAVAPEIEGLPERALDLARLAEVLHERGRSGREFFDRLAGEWDKLGDRFRTGQGRQRALAQLLPPGLVLADLGCGTGYFGEAALGLCSRLILVDSSPRMLEEAARRLEPRALGTRIEPRLGELERLPLADGEADGLLVGLVLHHLESHERALSEMLRVSKPGAPVVVVELAPHREEWMRSGLGDRHLGLEPAYVRDLFARAGFGDLRLDGLDDRYCPLQPDGDAGRPVALPLYSLRGRAPSDVRSSSTATHDPIPKR